MTGWANGRTIVQTRALLLERDGPYCGICHHHLGAAIPDIDHVQARAREGGDDLDNLRLAHPSCNRGRGVGLRRTGMQAWRPRRIW